MPLRATESPPKTPPTTNPMDTPQNPTDSLTEPLSALAAKRAGLASSVTALRYEIVAQRAIITALADMLEHEFWNQDHHGRESAHQAVRAIIDEARASVSGQKG